jgi:hypothetical protein
LEKSHTSSLDFDELPLARGLGLHGLPLTRSTSACTICLDLDNLPQFAIDKQQLWLEQLTIEKYQQPYLQPSILQSSSLGQLAATMPWATCH